MRFVLFFFLLLLSLPATAQEPKHVFLKLYAGADAAVPGDVLHLAIEQRIVPGWHTYWLNPGDSGEAMRITWDIPSGFDISDMLWPAPERVPYGPLVNYGYSDHAVMLADVQIPADAKPGTSLRIAGRADVLVCDEICIPETHDIALDIPIASKANDANADLLAAAGARLPQLVDWQTITEMDAQEVRVRISLPAASALVDAPEDIIWFPLTPGYIQNAADPLAMYEPATGTLTLRQARDQSADINLSSASYVLRVGDSAYQVVGEVTNAPAPVLGGAVPVGENADLPLMLLLIFAFVGGLILNLMPCVFPVLSMKALHLVNLPREVRRHAQSSGVFYALGVVTMFVILGAGLMMLREAGHQIGWGFQLQNPAVVTIIAWLMFVVGLNLAGVFDLRIAFGGEILLAEKHHPLVTSFITGVLATMVATPCSAPFMATAIGAAVVLPMTSALLVFAFVGLGLAFPYVLLCVVPAAQKMLPRPGAWMQTFRQVLAFPMFASAVWLVWVVAQQGGASAVVLTLSGMVALAFAIWLLDRKPARRVARHMVMVAGIGVIALTLTSLMLVIPQRLDAPASPSITAYKLYNAESLDYALNNTNDPVFVNMTAAWCITCLVNEKVTLDTQSTRDIFNAYHVRYFKGDWTNEDPSITAYLKRFGRSGVPLYVFYGAADVEGGTRPPAIVLPQILSNAALQELFE